MFKLKCAELVLDCSLLLNGIYRYFCNWALLGSPGLSWALLGLNHPMSLISMKQQGNSKFLIKICTLYTVLKETFWLDACYQMQKVTDEQHDLALNRSTFSNNLKWIVSNLFCYFFSKDNLGLCRILYCRICWACVL